MSLFSPFTRAHGVDISDKMIRLVDAYRTKEGITVKGFSEISMDEGVIADGEIKDFQKASNALGRLYKSINGSIDSRFALVAVPERKTFTKITTIEKLPEDEIEDAIQFEAEQHFPVSLEDMYLAWSLLESRKQDQVILLSATDKKIIEQYITLFQEHDVQLVVAEPETFAVKRSLLPDSNKTVLIIDLGKSKTTLTIVSNNTIKYTTTIGFSGSRLTDAIAHELQLDEEKAERAKLLFGMNQRKSKGVVRSLLIPLFEPFFDQVSDIIRYYTNTFESSVAIEQVLLCGGGSQMEGITQFIQQKLSIETKTQELALHEKDKTTRLFAKSAPLSYTTALGLALRNEEQKPFEMIVRV